MSGRKCRLEKSSTLPEMPAASFTRRCSPLPPAVVSFDSKGYIHSKKVNNYLIGGTLGEGSFAKVKEAYHVLVGEKVAMKVIDKKKAMQDAYVSKNFKREAKLLQKLNHPNIIKLFEVIETENNYYLIQELCSGGEVMKYIYKNNHLSEEETRKFVRQIVSAIDHLHRAGIIHRDLKVENLMLDDYNNIKLIDFGLSNEEVSFDEAGNQVHCKTQCGSPAYAAPELLGQRDYDKGADIWSIGVNMYAMLTGSLPFTVEPFNITALHAKMLQNKMNPIPDWVSDNCRDLLRGLLVANPAERITMDEIFIHPWLNEDLKLPFIPHPYPNGIKSEDIQDNIIEHMTEILEVGVAVGIKQDLLTNKATCHYAVYCLLSARLARYEKEYSNTKVHRSKDKRRSVKSKRVSKDHGFFDDDDSSDVSSTATAPTLGRKTSKSGGGTVLLRQNRSSSLRNRPRPISDDITGKASTMAGVNHERRRLSDIMELDARRNSLPSAVLQKQLERFQGDLSEGASPSTVTEKSRTKSFSPSHKVRVSTGTYPHGIINPLPTSVTGSVLDNMSPPMDPLEIDLNPHGSHYTHANLPSRNPLPSGKRSLPRDLNKLTHTSNTTSAWGSNPPSRTGSRQSSFSSMPPIRKNTGSFSLDSDNDELEFHNVTTPTTPGFGDTKASFFVDTPTPPPPHSSFDDSTNTLHLPSLDPKSTKKSPKRRNGWVVPPNGDCTIRTQLQVGAIIGEILRTAHDMKMKSEPQLANTIKCEHNSVTFEIAVRKTSTTSCTLHFEWLSGGSHRIYNDTCGQVLQRIHL